MARCRGRWSDFWQTPDPPPACDTPMAWNYPAMIGRLPRCLRRGPQGKKERHFPLSHNEQGGLLPREEPVRSILHHHPPTLFYCACHSLPPPHPAISDSCPKSSRLSDALALCGVASPTGKISPFSSDKPRAAACTAHEFLNSRPTIICLSVCLSSAAVSVYLSACLMSIVVCQSIPSLPVCIGSDH